MQDVELRVSVVTRLLALNYNFCHFLPSLSQPFSPLLCDETILTSAAHSGSTQKAQLPSTFHCKIGGICWNGQQSQTVACCADVVCPHDNKTELSGAMVQ